MHVVVDDVTHRYHRNAPQPVLDHVNLRINSGDTVALMAPSGAGKSTLLSILGGLLCPTTGTVTWNGEAPSSTVDQRVGWIFQTVNVLGHRTVLDNVALGVLGQGTTRADANRLAADALHRVGLSDKSTRRCQTLSGGEVQRVVVARALAGRRQLVFADEPTGQLDAATTDSVLDAIFNARLPTTTLVVASHDQRVAERCSRLIRIQDGAVDEVDQHRAGA